MLSHPNATHIPVSQLVDQLRHHPPGQRAEALTRLLSPGTAEADLGWVFELAEVAEAVDLPLPAVRKCTADLAWQARDAGQRLPDRSDLDRCEQAGNPWLARLALCYVHGQRLRADYQFAALTDASRGWLTDFPDDGMIAAFAAFGALGARHDSGLPLLTRTRSAPDCDRYVRAVCLQGLWFATQLPDQPRLLLELSDELFGRGEDDANVYYWRASALRRLGRFDEALASVDRAIALLPAGRNPVHQDYVRERELITTTQFLTEHIHRESTATSKQLRAELNEYLAEVRTEIERQSVDARRLVSGSMLSLVEVLGIFVAITGFLVASGAVVFRAASFWDGFAAVALLLFGALAFFLLLRFVVRFRARPPSGSLRSQPLER